jgi:hypothetical protein
VQNSLGQIVYQLSYQWAFQREVVKDFDVFVHGFYNAAALPRFLQFKNAESVAQIPNVTVVGVGAIKTVNDRLAIFGSYNFGVTPASPKTIALLGFAWPFEAGSQPGALSPAAGHQEVPLAKGRLRALFWNRGHPGADAAR